MYQADDNYDYEEDKVEDGGQYKISFANNTLRSPIPT